MRSENIIIMDQGGINQRILAKEAKADFRRIESASRKIAAALCSPEMKRYFLRYFASLQLNVHYISVIARTRLDPEAVERIEEQLKARIEKETGEVDEAIRGAELLFQAHGITSPATYDSAPLAMEVPVISPLSRRYLELILKVDQLLPLLETLAIDEVIKPRELDLRKGLFKKGVRRVANAARILAAGLRRRQGASATAAATPQGPVTEAAAVAPGMDTTTPQAAAPAAALPE